MSMVERSRLGGDRLNSCTTSSRQRSEASQWAFFSVFSADDAPVDFSEVPTGAQLYKDPYQSSKISSLTCHRRSQGSLH